MTTSDVSHEVVSTKKNGLDSAFEPTEIEETVQKERAVSKYALIIEQQETLRSTLVAYLRETELMCEAFPTVDLAVKALVKKKSAVPVVIFVGETTGNGVEIVDSLAVVKYLKRVPRAATIPILRYGFENDEFYTREARTLGAVGQSSMVLESVDLLKMLQKLKWRDEPSLSSLDVTRMDVPTLEVPTVIPLLREEPVVENVEEQHKEAHPQDEPPHKSSEPLGERIPSEPISSVQDIEDAKDNEKSAVGEGAHVGEHSQGKTLLKRKSMEDLLKASASNDAESFREHSSVIAYLRSLERRHDCRSTSASSRDNPLSFTDTSTRFAGRRFYQRDRLFDRASRIRFDLEAGYSNGHDESGDARGDGDYRTPGRWFGVEHQNEKLCAHLDGSLERLQQHVELEMIRQTGDIQTAVSDLMDAQTDAIKGKIDTVSARSIGDRWFRFFVIAALFLMPTLWLLMQVRFNMATQQQADRLSINTAAPAVVRGEAEASNQDMASALRISVEERTQLIENLESVLNQPVANAFDEVPMSDIHAQRLQNALNILTTVGFHGVVTIASHVSPYCVQYGEGGTPQLDHSKENVSECYLWPVNAIEASSFSQQQSVAFAEVLARFNQPNSPILVQVVSAVSEGEFWSVNSDGLIDPSANGVTLNAAQWNTQAVQKNGLTYQIRAFAD